MLEYRFAPSVRPQEGVICWSVGGMVVRIALSSVPGSDQYGESPFVRRGIDCGAGPVEAALSTGSNLKVAVLIDGGPRAHILSRFLELEDQYEGLNLTVFLCDAYRPYFKEVVGRRPNGRYLVGSETTLDGLTLYDSEDADKKNQSEIWTYRSPPRSTVS